MRTKLTLDRRGRQHDVVVTTDVGATVGDVAEALVRADALTRVDALTRAEASAADDAPVAPPGGVTLLRTPPDGGGAHRLDPSAGLIEVGLRAGSRIAVVPATAPVVEPGEPLATPPAVLRVLSGPDAGRAFPLRYGTTTVGRSPGADVRLHDRMVSTLHARIVVADSIEVVDAGSANGVLVGDGLVERATLTPSTTVVLGETLVGVERREPPRPTGTSGVVVPFNRSPRVVPRHPEHEVDAPEPPDPPSPGRFPVLALVAPLILGTVLFLATRSTLSLVFVALSPLLMIGTYVDKRLTDRRRVKTQTAEFTAALRQLEEDLARRRDVERTARLAEVPSTTEAVEAALRLTPVLWSRRPEHGDFLTVRLGTGRAASRTTVTLPARGKATADHWRMVEDLRDRWAEVDGVPITVDLRESRALGLAGPQDVLGPVARGVVAQLVCLHSPAELVVVGLASPESAAHWRWLRWLPHVTSPHSPLPDHHLASGPAAAAALVTRLEELVAGRRAGRADPGDRADPGGRGGPDGRRSPLPAVVVVVEDDAPADRGRLVRLTEEGAAVGVHVVWCAPTVEALPAVCRAFVHVADDGVPSARGGRAPVGRLGLVVDGRWSALVCEPLADRTTAALARRLAAVDDAGAPVVDESDLPRSVSYLDLAGRDLASDPSAVIDRWRETGSLLDRSGAPQRRRRQAATLRALVGQGTDRELVLDLRAQGPHALVGGTTGAGKSEFLQAWVLGMAAAHSPDRVTFLFIDYKGGAAFADCVDLPHSVGLVTDLSPHLVRRALRSLRAELRHREQLLNRKRAKDLEALERVGDPETPPALVIVIDEFAALVSEVPEFVDGVVDVAQRGRSLGLHLILATQRPAGVIKDNLRANTHLRVTLRMADEHDSTDVLGSPVAASFDPRVPGRGAVRTGPGRLAMFQAGYLGGRTTDAPPRPAVGVESLGFGPGEVWDVPAAPDRSFEVAEEGPTDVTRVVRTIGRAATVAGVRPPRRPWLPELGAVHPLADLVPSGGMPDTDLVLGVVDVPDRQEQRVLAYRPDVDGAMVVHGTSGSGKSTALRTLAVGAGLADGDVHVYGLDLGAGGLAMLGALPHVGAVIDGSDGERVARLLRTLRDVLDDRGARYSAARASTITEYRALAGRPDEPRILLLVDGLSAFREVVESEPGRAQTWAAFTRVVAEGRPLGVHVVMSAERPGALPTVLAGSVPRRLVLRQADEDAYGVLGVPKDVLTPSSAPGRGVVAGTDDELQVAVPGGPTAAEQAAEVERLAERMRAAGVRPAPEVRRLPSFVELSSMPPSVDGLPVLGVADDTLEPVGFAPSGTFLLAGLPGSGRTTVLTAIASSLRRYAPDGRLFLVGGRRSPVHEVGGVWTEVALTPDDAAVLARRLLPEVAEPPSGPMGVVLVVESIADLLGGPAEQPLAELVRMARRNGHLVVAEAETSAWGSSWPLVAEVRSGRRGLVLQPDHLDGDALFRTAFPRMSRAEFPPGRGVVVEQGRLRRVQVPVA